MTPTGLSLVLVVMQWILVSCKGNPWYTPLDCQYYAVPLLDMFVEEYKWQQMKLFCSSLLYDWAYKFQLLHAFLSIHIKRYSQQFMAIAVKRLVYILFCELPYFHHYTPLKNIESWCSIQSLFEAVGSKWCCTTSHDSGKETPKSYSSYVYLLIKTLLHHIPKGYSKNI